MITNPTTQAMKNLKQLPYGGAGAVVDPRIDSVIDEIMQSRSTTNWLHSDTIQNDFLAEFANWIHRSERNRLKNLDRFPIACYSSGTSESFDKFYLKNSTRRFRCFRGEYMYHMASWRNYFPNWCYLDQDDIRKTDAVVVSMPFSDTGDVHPDMEWLLDICEKRNVPVLIDCAFYGVCQDIDFDFNRDCITDVTFSLSKTFPVSHLRIGMRLTRTDDDDSLLVHHKTGYTNRLGAGLGLELIKRFSADYNCIAWSNIQKILCEELEIKPSASVIFGIDHRGERPEYNRGNTTNRLCLSKYLFERVKLL
jgi:hypothetical protein